MGKEITAKSSLKVAFFQFEIKFMIKNKQFLVFLWYTTVTQYAKIDTLPLYK